MRLRPALRASRINSISRVNCSSSSCNEGSCAARPSGKMVKRRHERTPSAISISRNSGSRPSERAVTQVTTSDAIEGSCAVRRTARKAAS